MVSEKQLAVITKERSKPKNKKLSWVEIAKILNDCGPCIKSSSQWNVVNTEQFNLSH